MTEQHHIKLFRIDDSQIVRIAFEIERPGDSPSCVATDRPVLQPVRKRGLLANLDAIEPFAEPFPDIDNGRPVAQEIYQLLLVKYRMQGSGG